MARDMSKSSSSCCCRNVIMCLCIVGLVSQNLVIHAVASSSFEDQKNYYPIIPDPHIGTPPPVSYNNPSPPYKSSPPSGHGGTPPYHSTPSQPTPSNPPSNCGNPPLVPTPSRPSPSHGGHYPPAPHDSTPSRPPPSHGGYYGPPTTPSGTPPPTTPSPGGTPPTPPVVNPPSPPSIVPGTPSSPTIPINPPFDPNSNPFSCDYWRNHPTLIWTLVGWWGTVGGAFGTTTSVPALPANMNLLEALSNTRTDGFGALYREGTASLLNSMAIKKFPFSTTHVRNSFVAALGSNRAAQAQARVFKLANEGHFKPRA